MVKGKYAARAANRLAALDNDLLRDKCAEIDALKAKIADLENQLHEERRSRDSQIVARADKLSADLIAEARQQFNASTAEMQRKLDEFMAPVVEQDKDEARFIRRYNLLTDQRTASQLGLKAKDGRRGARAAIVNRAELRKIERGDDEQET